MAAALLLPDPEHLDKVLAAARKNGVTRLKIGTFECELRPLGMVEQINRAAPLPPDPFDVIRGRTSPAGEDLRPDLAEMVASGMRIIRDGDPTQA